MVQVTLGRALDNHCLEVLLFAAAHQLVEGSCAGLLTMIRSNGMQARQLGAALKQKLQPLPKRFHSIIPLQRQEK